MDSPNHRARIGVDFHTAGGIFQGSRSYLLGIYREAIVLAPDIDFIFYVAEPAVFLREQPEFKRPNVQIVRLRQLSPVLRLAFQLAWRQWRDQLDLLHVQYRLPFLRVGACACTIHDVLFETHPQFFSTQFARMAKLTSRMAVRNADLLFAASDYSRAEIERIYNLPPNRIRVTHGAADLTRFYPGNRGAEVASRYRLTAGEYICIVGRIEPRKNHLGLILAYANLPEPRPTLVVIGQRDFGFHRVFEEIQRLGLDPEIRVLDTVDDQDLPALIRHARLFVYPSFAEGFGIPVLEAMASGVPVITSNTTSLPEVAGDAARLVDPEDIDALTAAMAEELEAGAEKRASRIAAGIDQARRFSWHKSASALVEGFREWLKGTS